MNARPPKIYRGSKKRVRRVALRGNWPSGWIVIVVVGLLLFAFFVLVPWMIRHPLHD